MSPVVVKSKKKKKKLLFYRYYYYSLAVPLYKDASGPQAAEKANKISWKCISYDTGVSSQFLFLSFSFWGVGFCFWNILWVQHCRKTSPEYSSFR